MGEAAATGCLGLYAKPSLPRKPMAGKGSLWSGKPEFSIDTWTDSIAGRGSEGEGEKERRPTYLCLGAASKDPITFLGGRKRRADGMMLT